MGCSRLGDASAAPFLTFVGISVDEDGGQHRLASQIASRWACLNAIEYLTEVGYSPEQAYLLLGAAPIEAVRADRGSCAS